ncbi:MAG: hypothetical protein GTO04_07110 [Planctomycetales bacterium]|nr:hypothetical protein [Planctomycetales bacterium]
MSYTADVREGVQWPTLAEDGSAGRPELRLRFLEPASHSGEGEGMILVAPRTLYDGGRLLAEAQVMAGHIQKPQIHLSRIDATKLGVGSGDQLVVSRNGTSVELPVRIERRLEAGVALVPRNVAGQPVEKLIGPGGLYTTVNVEKK